MSRERDAKEEEASRQEVAPERVPQRMSRERDAKEEEASRQRRGKRKSCEERGCQEKETSMDMTGYEMSMSS